MNDRPRAQPRSSAGRDGPAPPEPSLTLRAAVGADVPAILAFWRAAAHDDDRPTDRPEAVAALIERDPAALLLAIDDGGAIVGSVIAGWDGWRAHLYRLAVAPSHRRHGLGRWLLAAAEQRLAAHGAGRLDAMVIDDNDGGRAVWSAAGYRRQENWSRWVKPV